MSEEVSYPISISRATFNYDNGGQGKLIQFSSSGEDYQEFLEQLEGEMLATVQTVMTSCLCLYQMIRGCMHMYDLKLETR